MCLHMLDRELGVHHPQKNMGTVNINEWEKNFWYNKINTRLVRKNEGFRSGTLNSWTLASSASHLPIKYQAFSCHRGKGLS